MRTITFVSQKGGSGKTTLATNLAVAAQEAGETVALLDLDPQQSTFGWGRRRERSRQRAETDGKTELEAKLSHPHVEAYPLKQIANLERSLAALEKEFSLVLLDTPGTDSVATHHAMAAATLCLVPVQPTAIEIAAIKPTLLALMRGDHAFATVLNRCHSNAKNSRASETAQVLRLSGLLIEPFLVGRNDYQDAYTSGLGVVEFNPKEKAAREIRELWQSVAALLNEPQKPSKLKFD